MVKKQRLTLDEHKALGQQMYTKRDELLRMACTMSNTYGIGTLVSRHSHKTVSQVDRLRSHMDGQFARDFPGSYCPDVYYPGPESMRETHRRLGCETCYPTGTTASDTQSTS